MWVEEDVTNFRQKWKPIPSLTEAHQTGGRVQRQDPGEGMNEQKHRGRHLSKIKGDSVLLGSKVTFDQHAGDTGERKINGVILLSESHNLCRLLMTSLRFFIIWSNRTWSVAEEKMSLRTETCLHLKLTDGENQGKNYNFCKHLTCYYYFISNDLQDQERVKMHVIRRKCAQAF